MCPHIIVKYLGVVFSPGLNLALAKLLIAGSFLQVEITIVLACKVSTKPGNIM